MLSNGADVHRVEDTVERLGHAFEFSDCHVLAINPGIIVTMTHPTGAVETQTRRIRQINTDLNMVSELNNLSREICAGKMDLDQVQKRIEEIRTASPYPEAVIYFGYIITAAFFTLLFGGTIRDMLFSAPVGALLLFVKNRMEAIHNNKMMINIILSALCTLLAMIGEAVLPVLHSDMIIIGNIMLLIPGLAFCNSIHDMVRGETISGLLSLADAILRALSIAIGYVAAWVLIGRFL